MTHFFQSIRFKVDAVIVPQAKGKAFLLPGFDEERYMFTDPIELVHGMAYLPVQNETDFGRPYGALLYGEPLVAEDTGGDAVEAVWKSGEIAPGAEHYLEATGHYGVAWRVDEIDVRPECAGFDFKSIRVGAQHQIDSNTPVPCFPFIGGLRVAYPVVQDQVFSASVVNMGSEPKPFFARLRGRRL